MGLFEATEKFKELQRERNKKTLIKRSRFIKKYSPIGLLIIAAIIWLVEEKIKN